VHGGFCVNMGNPLLYLWPPRVVHPVTTDVEASSRTKEIPPPDIDDEVDEPLDEPPTSWHHVTRMRCLYKGYSPAIRWAWYFSTLLLVTIQILVMISFSSSLSVKRCLWQPSDEEGECDDGAYCAGMNTMPLARDPLSNGLQASIRLGYCQGCGTRLPDEYEIPNLLELLCPVSGRMDSCMSACAAPNGGHDWLMSTHMTKYTPLELGCASACSQNATSSLSPDELSVFEEASGLHRPQLENFPPIYTVDRYAAWLSVIQQCVACPESLRAGVAYMTASENENNTLLKMSLFDHISLALCAVIVALTLTREIRDINIGKMMTLQAKERDRLRNAGKLDGPFELGPHSIFWEWMLGFPVALRRYSIIPDVAITVVLMVLRMGGDTVSVMLNTLAALFMLEVDNLAFDYGLTAQTKAKVEKEFKVVLAKDQINLLNSIRRWHVLALTVVIIASVQFIVTVHSRAMRMRILTIVLVAIIGFGELLEIIARRKKRTTSENAQRGASLMCKVAISITFKWYMVGLQSLLAPVSVYW